MAKLSRDLASTTLHPREDIFSTGTLGALNSEIIINSDGCSTVALDLRGTFSLTVEVSGTVDGTNWTPIAMRAINQASKLFVAAVAGTAAGTWIGAITGFRQVKARVSAYTSGSATTTISASVAPYTDTKLELNSPILGTATGAAGAAVTLTIAAPGAGLRQYITSVAINRFASALLTAGAAPVVVTTTNLPGSLAWSLAADALAAGALDRFREDYTYPIAASAQNTAVTIVCPLTTSVIWRVTATYYVAP